MFVYNNCTRDARVMRQASALRDAGNDVTIVAVLDNTTVPDERRDGIRIVRIDRDPLHYRLLRWSRRASWRGRRVRLRTRRTMRGGLGPVRQGARALLAGSRSTLEGARGQVRSAVLAASPVQQTVLLVLYLPVFLFLSVMIRFLDRIDRHAEPTSGPPRRNLPSNRMLATLVQCVEEIVAAPWKTARWSVETLRRALLRVHKPLMFLDYYRRAHRAALEQPADAYHAHDLNTLPVAVVAAHTTQGRLVYDAHELYPAISTLSRREARIWAFVERVLIRRPDRVMTVCESIADELAHRYRVARPVVLLNCPPRMALGVTPSLSLRSLAGIEREDSPIVLYQGGFAANRGLQSLVRAAGRLEQAVIVLMGWGRLEEELTRLVGELDLKDRVRIIEPVEPRNVLAYAAQADVGVIPYEPVGLNNTYSTPNKLFDFMMAGLPIAASSLPELSRFIDGLGIGRTFTPGDPMSIAAAINAILHHSTTYQRMRSNALVAGQRFCWDEESKKLLDLYQHLVA